MIYVFEGSRNSGKTYLSNRISDLLNLKRFQFEFGQGFNLLGLESKNNRETHSFSMGKELMILQLGRDLKGDIPSFIHDRGILSVLAWGLFENRISEEDIKNQINYIIKNKLLNNFFILYIEGNNPNKSERNKDQWDYADKNPRERECFDFVISKFKESGFDHIYVFENDFTENSVSSMETLFKNIIPFHDVRNITNY